MSKEQLITLVSSRMSSFKDNIQKRMSLLLSSNKSTKSNLNNIGNGNEISMAMINPTPTQEIQEKQQIQYHQEIQDVWRNEAGTKWTVIYPFVGENATELTVERGQTLEGMATNGTWHLVKNPITNQSGLVPSNHLQSIV